MEAYRRMCAFVFAAGLAWGQALPGPLQWAATGVFLPHMQERTWLQVTAREQCRVQSRHDDVNVTAFLKADSTPSSHTPTAEELL